MHTWDENGKTFGALIKYTSFARNGPVSSTMAKYHIEMQ
jgi:hypothetical protein